MPLVRQPINNLLGGVSQQAPAVRSLDQCERMENAWPSPILGLTKRPPTKHIKKLAQTPESTSKYHIINRSPTEQYLLVFKNNILHAYTLKAIAGYLSAGAQMVIQDPAATGYNYLISSTAAKLKVHTVADYTFIVNNSITTAMDILTTAAKPFNTEAYVFVRQGNYKTNYSIRIKVGGTDQTVTVKTWNGTTGIAGSTAVPSITNTELNSIKTDDIAQELLLRLDNAWNGASGYVTGTSGIRKGSVVKVTFTSVANIVETVDSVGDSVLATVWKEIPRVAGYLPEICTDGFIVKVGGTEEIVADDYYVKFISDEGVGTFAKGHWQESLNYSQEYQFLASTMPHVLIRLFDDGTNTAYGLPAAAGVYTGTVGAPFFAWRPGAWTIKATGDLTVNPRPSFIGKKLQNVFFYKQRLGFLADDRVLLSEVNEPFNFWRTTMLSLLDSDPIDVLNTHTNVALCKSATPYNENVILKSARGQFVLKGGEILSPRTVQITSESAYETYEDLDPINAGRSLFFGFKHGDYSGIREFYQINDQDQFDSVDVTLPVPNYLSGEIDHFAVSTLEETLVVKTSTSANRLWIYKYLWAGNTKILSSWSLWDLTACTTVAYFGFIDNTLYLVTSHSDGYYIEKLELASGLVDPSSTFTTLLDRRVDQSQVTGLSYSAGPNTSTFTLPYTLAAFPGLNIVPIVVRKSDGVIYTPVSNTTTTVTVTGNLTAIDFWTGVNYIMYYEFTKPLIKLPAGRGLVPETGCVQRVKHLELQYSSTGWFILYVDVAGHPQYIYFNGIDTMTWGAIIYQPGIIKTDKARIPIHGRADELTVLLTNPYPYPSNISSAIWEILMYESGTRLPGASSQ